MRNWLFRYHRLVTVALSLAALLAVAGIIAAQPPVPHAVMEGEDCLSCHQSGAAGAPRVAWDHLGRGNEDCLHCHQVTGAPAGAIPHPIFGRDDCLSCHREGVGDTPILSGSHVYYENEQCQECHQVSAAAAEPTPIPTPVPAPVHEDGEAMVTVEACISCHQLIFADEQHVLFTGQPLGDIQIGAVLFVESCARCHGEDGSTPVGTDQVVIGSEEYWGTHDDAAIIWGIGAGTHGQMTAFAEAYGGPLSWEQVLDLTALVRSWGALGEPAMGVTPGGLTYRDAIGPMLTERCSACHGGLAGLTVTDYDSLLAGSASGPVLVPGDPEGSRIVEVQSGEHYGQLDPAELDILIEWISAGAPR
jgi:mono/diheme cytochrome c family protein